MRKANRIYGRSSLCLLLWASVVVAAFTPCSANAAAVSYGYDALGRLTTALYDNGLCIVYAYDASGNRTSQNNTSGSAPESPVWGTGVWGCAKWTP